MPSVTISSSCGSTAAIRSSVSTASMTMGRSNQLQRRVVDPTVSAVRSHGSTLSRTVVRVKTRPTRNEPDTLITKFLVATPLRDRHRLDGVAREGAECSGDHDGEGRAHVDLL